MKSQFLQQKECSNQKIEENKSGFLLKSKCPILIFEIWVFGANLTEPYWTLSFSKSELNEIWIWLLVRAFTCQKEKSLIKVLDKVRSCGQCSPPCACLPYCSSPSIEPPGRPALLGPFLGHPNVPYTEVWWRTKYFCCWNKTGRHVV